MNAASRYVLGLFLLLVEGFGLDDDGKAVGGVDRSYNARISDAWHGEHDLKICHWDNWLAVLSRFLLISIMCASWTRVRFRLSLKVVTRRVGCSSPVWPMLNFICGSRAREPVSPLGLVDIPGDQSRPNGKGKGKEEKKGDKNAASAGTAVPPAPTLCCISMEWQVGMGLAELTVTLSTTVRVHHCGACVCGCECACVPMHSVRCRSTAEWLSRGRLGPSVSGLVPALSFPTHLVFILTVLYGMVSHPRVGVELA